MTLVLEQYGRLPCDSGWGSQKFSKSKHPAIDIGFLHKYGEYIPVKAWKSGKVIATGTDSAGGVYVVLRHEDVDCDWITRYWHLKKGSVVVKKGQEVKQGDKLGTRGKTGISTGTHLHFEIWKVSKSYKYKSGDASKYAVDPTKYTFIFDGQKFTQGCAFNLETKPEEVVVEVTPDEQIAKLTKELALKDKALDTTIQVLNSAIKTIEDVQKAVK